MKLTKQVCLVFGLIALSTGAGNATISLTTQFGVATDSSSVAVPDGTLWALIVDSDAVNGGLPQLNVNSGISASLSSPFWYKNLSVGGTVNSDQVFAMGAFNGTTAAGIAGAWIGGLSNLTLPAGKNFGLYWFPGVTFTGDGTYLVGNGLGHQVGGINSTTVEDGADIGMVVPADGFPYTVSASSSALSGAVPAANFVAVSIIPEPSSMLLGALGALGLLRRRR